MPSCRAIAFVESRRRGRRNPRVRIRSRRCSTPGSQLAAHDSRAHCAGARSRSQGCVIQLPSGVRMARPSAHATSLLKCRISAARVTVLRELRRDPAPSQRLDALSLSLARFPPTSTGFGGSGVVAHASSARRRIKITLVDEHFRWTRTAFHETVAGRIQHRQLGGVLRADCRECSGVAAASDAARTRVDHAIPDSPCPPAHSPPSRT